jgi:hypothetical protein
LHVHPKQTSLPAFVATLTVLVLLASTASALPPLAITGGIGVQSRPDFEGSGFGYNLAVYNRFDEQVLIGVQSGQGIAGHPSSVPVLAAGFMRLPFGRIFVPAATGGIGYALGSGDGRGFLWRAGGLLDIRNGRRSSLLLGCEYEGFDGRGGLAVRGGVLLDL